MSLTATTPTDREIVLTRTFAAPGRLVFDAYTRPELLTQWYGARGWHLACRSGHDAWRSVASQVLTRVAAPVPDVSTRSAMVVEASSCRQARSA